MRGKDCDSSAIWSSSRITPAYAGKSIEKIVWQLFFKDHPRLCGEKMETTVAQIFHVGSPPPMRGKGVTILQPSNYNKDHPRLCGEKSPIVCANL